MNRGWAGGSRGEEALAAAGGAAGVGAYVVGASAAGDISGGCAVDSYGDEVVPANVADPGSLA